MQSDVTYIICADCGKQLGRYSRGSGITISHSCVVESPTPIVNHTKQKSIKNDKG